MAHGGYGKRTATAAEWNKPADNRRPKALNVNKKSKLKKPKAPSLKNQIRSTERLLRKDLSPEVKEAQEKKLEELKKQQEIHARLVKERKIFLQNRKIRFFERRKIDRRIRQLEKQQRASTDQAQEAEIADQLSKLKEDLQYVRFFPKTEKYVPLFIGGDGTEIVEKRNSLRKQIQANLIAAAASGKDLEETGGEDDGLLDPSDDDFFLNGSSSDEANADDEWVDKSAREQASSAFGKAASGVSNYRRDKKQIPTHAPPPWGPPSRKPFSNSQKNKSRSAGSSGKKPHNKAEISTLPHNTSSGIGRSSFKMRGPVDSTTGNSGNLISNSDARKPRRKRRPKKKKKQQES
ncbi:hypothetical protein CDL12_26181 [Handroanthus impetiginosus]|uniref:rRNA-processing protein EFG1 n=1 Tax=Handroanthus impetiginosus TaxID=429701 RepID=A0A2G9G7N9_9LAMI|nr:hypothetical protein CDL12_26181 [Handroanthus impetiginosus]